MALPTSWDRRLPFVLGAVLVLLVLAVGLSYLARRPDEIGSVAVLPIQPLTPDEELSAVGLSITDAVTQRLAYARSFTVRPLSSVQHYVGRVTDPAAAGREMKVDAVLTGSIQRQGERFRVTTRLIDVRTKRSRWNGKIEEKAGDVFRLQDKVAEAALRSVPSETGPVPAARRTSRHRPSPEAHQAFLKGRYYWSRRTGKDVSRAVEEFERAITLDDSYAAAWAGLASAINLESLHFTGEPNVSFARAKSAARQALVLDPREAEAHAAMGFLNFYYDWKWTEAEKSLRRAIELDATNGNYRQLLSNLLMVTGRFDEGIRQIQEAKRVDPGSIMVRAVAAHQFYLARRYEEALAASREAIEMDPGFAAPHTTMGRALFSLGRNEEAKREIEQAITLNSGPEGSLELAVLEASDGNAKRAEELISEARSLAPSGAALDYDLAAVHVALGDFDAAFASLDRAIEERYSGMVWLNVDPRLDALRADPRFDVYLRRMAL